MFVSCHGYAGSPACGKDIVSYRSSRLLVLGERTLVKTFIHHSRSIDSRRLQFDLNLGSECDESLGNTKHGKRLAGTRGAANA